MSQPIRQEVVFTASPAQVYEALMSSEQHAQFTGGSAEISRDEGGAFSCHDGQILGRNVELIENQRIVQAWRVAAWPEGVYSIVRFELTAEGDQTRVVLDHLGVDEGAREMIEKGWTMRYWEPLAKFLS